MTGQCYLSSLKQGGIRQIIMCEGWAFHKKLFQFHTTNRKCGLTGKLNIWIKLCGIEIIFSTYYFFYIYIFF